MEILKSIKVGKMVGKKRSRPDTGAEEGQAGDQEDDQDCLEPSKIRQKIKEISQLNAAELQAIQTKATTMT